MGITHIGNYAFSGCTYAILDHNNGDHLPNALVSIGDCAFMSCDSIEHVDIPYYVTSIGRQAFDYCKSLKYVSIMNTPTIGNWAFGDCPKLEKVSFYGKVPTFSNLTFDGSHAIDAYYPPGSSAWTESVQQDYGGTVTWSGWYYGRCGDTVSWYIDDGTLILNGYGKTWSYYQILGSKKNFVYTTLESLRSKINKVTVGSGLTTVGAFLLHNLENATEIFLTPDLKEIDHYAFYKIPFITILWQNILCSSYSLCNKFHSHLPY